MVSVFRYGNERMVGSGEWRYLRFSVKWEGDEACGWLCLLFMSVWTVLWWERDEVDGEGNG